MDTQFHNLSLNGITGILFGIISILYIFVIQTFLNDFSAGIGIGFLPISYFEIILLALSIVYILISFFTITLSNRKRRRRIQLVGWDTNSKKILKVFVAFLTLGGIITYFLGTKGGLKLTIPLSLIIYGIASLIVEKYTNGNTAILGILCILNGIISYVFPNYAFLLWGIAFGFYHIVYGIIETKALSRP